MLVEARLSALNHFPSHSRKKTLQEAFSSFYRRQRTDEAFCYFYKEVVDAVLKENIAGPQLASIRESTRKTR